MKSLFITLSIFIVITVGLLAASSSNCMAGTVCGDEVVCNSAGLFSVDLFTLSTGDDPDDPNDPNYVGGELL